MSRNQRTSCPEEQNHTRDTHSIRCLLVLTVLVWSSHLFAAQSEEPTDNSGTAEAETPFPEWSDIETVVKTHFENPSGKKVAGRRKSRFRKRTEQSKDRDLITQKDLSGLFAKIEKQGWMLSKKDRKQILDRVLSDQDFLARQLRTRQGKKFMRSISSLPGGYDRLDRLLKMPHGKKRLQELIKSPDGNLLIEYMTTTKYGKNLGKQLAKAKNGRNFNEPTGKLYTAKDVLKQLEKSYQAEVERRESEDLKSKKSGKKI